MLAPLLIRTATSDDLDATVALWREHGAPTRGLNALADARALIDFAPDALLVATDDAGSVVGSLIVGWDGWRCHLYRLVVHPSCRRDGVASALLTESRNRARARGAARVDAMVRRENAGAVAFWEANGFTLQDDDGRWSSVL